MGWRGAWCFEIVLVLAFHLHFRIHIDIHIQYNLIRRQIYPNKSMGEMVRGNIYTCSQACETWLNVSIMFFIYLSM